MRPSVFSRYLSKTFRWAIWAYQPQVIVFLGDLVDEGSECSDEEFKSYAKRFKGIYDNKATNIYVAGDNDIGGEGSDPVTEEKVERFRQQFPTNEIFSYEWKQHKLIEKLQ